MPHPPRSDGPVDDMSGARGGGRTARASSRVRGPAKREERSERRSKGEVRPQQQWNRPKRKEEEEKEKEEGRKGESARKGEKYRLKGEGPQSRSELSSEGSDEVRKSLWRNGTGPEARSEETDQEESEEESGQKRKEGLIQRQQQFIVQQRRKPQQRGTVPRRSQSQGSGPKGSPAAHAVEEMREYLLTLSGEGAIPPLALQYYRMMMRSKMSGGMAREALTVAYIVDLGLQGRIAEAMDVALQRLKSLELSSQRHGLPSQPKNRVSTVGPRSRSVEHRTSSSSTGSSRRGQAEETKRKRRRLGKRGLLEGRPQRKVGTARRERQREERRPEGRRPAQRRPRRGREEGREAEEVGSEGERELDGHSWTPSPGMDL